MINRRYLNALCVWSATVGFGFVAVATVVFATRGQAAPQSGTPATGAPAAKLTTYTATDKSASVGVPDGWKVTQGSNLAIRMTGPNGESAALGINTLVKDGPYHADKPESTPLWLTMPNSDSLAQKYMMILEAADAGNPQPPNLQIKTTTAIAIPKAMADCARFTGTVNLQNGPGQFELAFCSLPIDPAGVYKVIWKTAALPNALVTQERATAEAVLASYTVTETVLKNILAPYDAPPTAQAPAASGGATDAGTAATLAAMRRAQQASDEQFTCFDEGVIREVPQRRLPPYCQ